MLINKENIGQTLFFIGVFLLSSTLVFAALFLFAASLIGSFSNRDNYFKDNWNKCFFIGGTLIILSTIFHYFILENPHPEIWDPSLSIIGITNWLPFFWLFWAIQPFLNNKYKRRNLGLILISGSFPVIFTGFGQYFFNWTGPFELFNGLVVWYLKPVEITKSLTGLFSNQNYAGAWLNFIWPFCLAFILEKNEAFLKKTIAFIFLISVGAATFLTTSRSAWGGLLISLPLVIGSESLIWIIPLILSLILFIFWIVSPLFSGDLQNFFREFINQDIWIRFTPEGYIQHRWQDTRFTIMSIALKYSFIRPLIGLGAASFPIFYEIQTEAWFGHPHNLILELAISYGIPSAVILFSTIFILITISGKILFTTPKDQIFQNLYDRAIWASIFFFFVSQLVDVQYFDGRISIMAWILLACLKNIINEQKFKANDLHS